MGSRGRAGDWGHPSPSPSMGEGAANPTEPHSSGAELEPNKNHPASVLRQGEDKQWAVPSYPHGSSRPPLKCAELNVQAAICQSLAPSPPPLPEAAQEVIGISREKAGPPVTWGQVVYHCPAPTPPPPSCFTPPPPAQPAHSPDAAAATPLKVNNWPFPLPSSSVTSEGSRIPFRQQPPSLDSLLTSGVTGPPSP